MSQAKNVLQCSLMTWPRLVGWIYVGNMFSKVARHCSGLKCIFQIFFTVLRRVHACSSLPASVTGNSSPNRANRIPLESLFNVDHKYGHGFVYSLTYIKILSRKVLLHKFQIQISTWILNDLTRFKLQFVLCRALYLNRITIAWINEFDF